MNEETDTDLSRRDVLKRASLSTGALALGGTALAGRAAAKPKAVAYTFNDPVAAGDRYTIDSFEGIVERKCEGRGQGRGKGNGKGKGKGKGRGRDEEGNRPHEVELYYLRDIVGTVLVLSNSLSLEPGDEVEVAKVIGECPANGATKIQLMEV